MEFTMFVVECVLHEQRRLEQQKQQQKQKQTQQQKQERKGLEQLTQHVFDEYSKRFENDSLFRTREVEKAKKASALKARQRGDTQARQRLIRKGFPFK
jgi:response regulator of citrate/malate metabolism